MLALPGVLLDAGDTKTDKAFEELAVMTYHPCKCSGCTGEGVGMGGAIKRTEVSCI